MTNIDETIRNIFPGKTVVILGDLVADQFLNGTISRVSREAPVFILRHETTETIPGAAANAAVNVASLGGRAKLVGLAGKDANGCLLIDKLQAEGVDCGLVVSDTGFSTTTKVRVLAAQHYAARQQVIRIDYENDAVISSEIEQKLRENFAEAAGSADAIIVSDYNYGAVFPAIFDDARSMAADRGIPLIVDSRYRLAELSNATSATPNREEVEQMLGKHFTADDCSRLRETLSYQALLVTNGNQGMTLFEQDRPPRQFNVVGPPEPVDVTGAGDTVIAAYALALASGLCFGDAATVANHAGGIVVMKKGTASVKAAELLESLNGASETASVIAN